MLNISVLCVGRLREQHYIAAFAEYEKRLKPYCKFTLTELPEDRLPQNPSPAEISAALAREAAEKVLDDDPGLSKPENRQLRELAERYRPQKVMDFSMIS